MVAAPSEAVRAQRALSVGVVLFRWGALAWMLAIAATAPNRFVHPWVAWIALGVAGAVTVWASVPRLATGWTELVVEFAVAFALVLLAGYVVVRGAVVQGQFFATA